MDKKKIKLRRSYMPWHHKEFTKEVFEEGIKRGYRWIICSHWNNSFHDPVDTITIKRVKAEKLRNKMWNITNWEEWQALFKKIQEHNILKGIELWKLSRKS